MCLVMLMTQKERSDMRKVIGHCDCKISGESKTGIPIVKKNDKTVWVIYKDKVIKRHKEKHCVEIK